jgi:hypothetical protein
LVPLHASTCKVLGNYIARRNRHWAERPVSSYLFVSSWGNRLDSGDVHRTFYALSRQIGLRGPLDSRGPRLHDMRDRFCDKHTRSLVSVQSGSRAPFAALVGLPRSCACRRYAGPMQESFLRPADYPKSAISGLLNGSLSTYSYRGRRCLMRSILPMIYSTRLSIVATE